VIAKDGMVVARSANKVIQQNDPTAHAEIAVIRMACQELGTYNLEGCVIYTSCEPCPMCLGAIYWARPKRVIYANTRLEAAAIKFDDEFIYQQINTDMLQRTIPFIHEPHPLALQVFEDWKKIANKKLY
jgi:tRNA(Arg) A34 adenosine deaminase TadA